MRLALVTLIVPDYDEGIAFFVGGLGWRLLSDEDQGRKRWVTVAPPATAPSSEGISLLLAVATTEAQQRALGQQTGDRVGFFLQTDDFARDAARLTAAGGALIETPRVEPYGTVAQWRDPWGNFWDLIEPA
ncbi:VOC family protein [Rhodobacteraceae bacterium N5(2021)]|uniref:VOC family protein n=1 Tax=Gymnodinialimonas phycosphaerae TaxID=2841589 RepID=A0A975TVJ1_9RHOB|nr:VOC family protein [Gymnodinialimonas phycosphaerae]MBY4891703.1 VOC family protein [Gymnodinialimonas phycosphaerae]